MASTAEELRQLEESRKAQHAYEKKWMEAGELYADDFRDLERGKLLSEFNLIRLSNLYAVACICYYSLDFSPMSDALFDGLCLYLYEHYDEAIQAGVWSGVLEKEMLACGSGYHWRDFRLPLHNIAYCVWQILLREKASKWKLIGEENG